MINNRIQKVIVTKNMNQRQNFFHSSIAQIDTSKSNISPEKNQIFIKKAEEKIIIKGYQ